MARARISTCQCASPVCWVKADGMARNDRAGFGQRAVERREAQVVADREAEPAPRQVGTHRELARPVAARLAIALAVGEIDVEHVDLVVARDDLAAADRSGSARLAALSGATLMASEPICRWIDELARQLAEGREAGVVLLRHDGGEQLARGSTSMMLVISGVCT